MVRCRNEAQKGIRAPGEASLVWLCTLRGSGEPERLSSPRVTTLEQDPGLGDHRL